MSHPIPDPSNTIRFNPDIIDPELVIQGLVKHLADRGYEVQSTDFVIDWQSNTIISPIEFDLPSNLEVPSPSAAQVSNSRVMGSTSEVEEHAESHIPQWVLMQPSPGSTPSPSTTGGPATSAQEIECDHNWDIKFKLPDTQFFTDLSATSPDSTVNVFIMDTSPFDSAIKDHDTKLIEELQKDDRENFPPIKAILDNPSPIHIKEYTANDITNGIGDNTNSMPNHGIFIASIIKMIAPQAKVHLISIMNPNGAGALQDLITELGDIEKNNASDNSQVLVNISANAKQTYDTKDFTAEQIRLNKLLETNNISDEDAKSLSFYTRGQLIDMLNISSQFRDAVANFANDNRTIIAAAGNDWTTTVEPPWPQFPAYVKGVLSVGAIRSDGIRTDYSNLPQVPTQPQGVDITDVLTDFNAKSGQNENDALYAYGGTANAGLIGLYLSNFRNVDTGAMIANNCGIAHWAGTSFATAMVTGWMAWLCLRGKTVKEAKDILATLPKAHGLPSLMSMQEGFPVDIP